MIMSNQYIKIGLYIVGTAVVGGTLLFFVPPSSANSLEVQQKSLGILNKDIMDSRRNTQQLMTRLQQTSGADTTKK